MLIRKDLTEYNLQTIGILGGVIVRFINCDELKNKYMVYGSFYNIDYGNDFILKCRDYLEIVLRENHGEIERKNTPDCIFILMNPGSSEPINRRWSIKTFNLYNLIKDGEVKGSLYEAKGDITIYQLMRVMYELNYSHIRVINLCDIREGAYSNFLNKEEDMLKIDGDNLYSIFSEKRKVELKNKIGFCNRIVTAWGCDERLDYLISLALLSGEVEGRIGINKNGDRFYYKHPRQHDFYEMRKWVDEIVKIIREDKVK